MKNQELDDILRRKLNISSNVPEHIWDDIDIALTEQEKTKTMVTSPPFWKQNRKSIITAAAAVTLLIATAGSFYLFNKDAVLPTDPNEMVANDKSNPLNTNTGIKTSDASLNNEESINDKQDIKTNNKPNNNLQQSANIVFSPFIEKESITANPNASNLLITNSTSSNTPANFETIALIHPDLSGQKGIQINIPIIPIQPLAIIKEKNTASYNTIGLQDRAIEKEWMAGNEYSESTIFNNKKNTAKSNSNDVLLGFAGGYNYGSLSNGGSLALNTRKQLNSKLFVDGSIGLVMNNSSNEQNNFKGDYMSFKKEFAQKISSNNMENLYSQTDPFYFIQVNPSIGINVTKNLDVSIGPDYQQMVSNYSHDVINLVDQSKVLPRYDFGVTGKAELSLSKRIKAGVMMREGLTSIIMNNSNISDRRYFQLQLKYQLPYKND